MDEAQELTGGGGPKEWCLGQTTQPLMIDLWITEVLQAEKDVFESASKRWRLGQQLRFRLRAARISVRAHYRRRALPSHTSPPPSANPGPVVERRGWPSSSVSSLHFSLCPILDIYTLKVWIILNFNLCPNICIQSAMIINVSALRQHLTPSCVSAKVLHPSHSVLATFGRKGTQLLPHILTHLDTLE